MRKVFLSLLVSLMFVSSSFAFEYVPSRFNVLILMDPNPHNNVVKVDGVEYVWNNGWFAYQNGTLHYGSRDRLPRQLRDCTGHDINLEKQNILTQWRQNHSYRHDRHDYPSPQTHPSFYKNNYKYRNDYSNNYNPNSYNQHRR